MDKKLKSILKKEKLEHLLPVFMDQDVTDSILGDFSDGDLRDLGIDKMGERKRLLAAFQTISSGDSALGEMVEVEGGILPKESELAGTKVGTFQIGKYAVIMEEWQGVRSWAIANGFCINSGEAVGPRHPVAMVNWYDCVKWCNAKSLMKGLDPAYGLRGRDGYYCREEFGNDGSDNIVLKPCANGYRLLTEAEWEWAARGGCNSQGYTFAGSNNLDAVGWYEDNSGYKNKSNEAAHEVGKKVANELGLYDMSGNVIEWCWDLNDLNGSNRSMRGGNWHIGADNCAVSHRFAYIPKFRSSSIGVRLALNS